MSQSKSVAVLLSLLAGALLAPAAVTQDQPADKPELFTVVQVDEEFRVVGKDEVEALKKQLAEEHKQAVADHKQRKAEAKKAKAKFTEPAPKPKKLKVVKAGLEQEKADALVKELEEKAKKGGGGGGGGGPKKEKKEKKPKAKDKQS